MYISIYHNIDPTQHTLPQAAYFGDVGLGVWCMFTICACYRDLQLPRAEVVNSILPPFLVKRILRNPSHAIGDRAWDPTICGCWVLGGGLVVRKG